MTKKGVINEIFSKARFGNEAETYKIFYRDFEMTQATNPYVVIPMHGSPEQMEEFSNLVEGSGMGTIVTIPSALEIIIPTEVVPEFGLLSIVVLSSGMGMVIYILRQKSLIQIKC